MLAYKKMNNFAGPLKSGKVTVGFGDNLNEKLFPEFIKYCRPGRHGWLVRNDCRRILHLRFGCDRQQADTILKMFKQDGLLCECRLGFQPTKKRWGLFA